MFSIYFRKNLRQFAWAEGWRDDAQATCKTQGYAEELVRILNRADGPTQQITLATHIVRRAA